MAVGSSTLDASEITPEKISTWFYEGNKNVWDVLVDNSLYIFTLQNPIRKLCVTMLLNEWFDRVILFAIIGNSLFLAADNPLNNNHEMVISLSKNIYTILTN
jgi:hypothetical protein